MADSIQTPFEALLGGIGSGMEGYYQGRIDKQTQPLLLQRMRDENASTEANTEATRAGIPYTQAQTGLMQQQTSTAERQQELGDVEHWQDAVRANPNLFKEHPEYVDQAKGQFGKDFPELNPTDPTFGKVKLFDPLRQSLMDQQNNFKWATEFPQIMNAPGVPMASKMAQIRALATATDQDMGKVNQILLSNGVPQAMQQEWQQFTSQTNAKLQLLYSQLGLNKQKGNLDATRAANIVAMAPYQQGLAEAHIDRWRTLDEALGTQLSQKQSMIDIANKNLTLRAAEFQSGKDYKNANARRMQISALQNQARENVSLINNLLLQLQTNGNQYSDEQKVGIQQMIQQHTDAAQQFTQMAGAMAQESPMLPPGAPQNFQPSNTPANQASGQASLDPNARLIVHSGPNTGKGVWNGHLWGRPPQPGMAPIDLGPYTPNPSDQLGPP